MPNFCQLTIAGHLSQSPELKTTQSGVQICISSIAYNYGSGDKREVCFISLTLFKETAERFHSWMKKGDAVLVSGRLRQENWTDKETGGKRSKHSMVVERFENLTPKEGSGAPQSEERIPPPARRNPAASKPKAPPTEEDYGTPF